MVLELHWPAWGFCPHQEYGFLQGLLVSLTVRRTPPSRCQCLGGMRRRVMGMIDGSQEPMKPKHGALIFTLQLEDLGT